MLPNSRININITSSIATKTSTKQTLSIVENAKSPTTVPTNSDVKEYMAYGSHKVQYCPC